MKKGKIIILSGPSGVGKSTIRKIFLKHKNMNFSFSVSVTTRKKRKYEIEGKDYFFVNKKNFKKLIKKNIFLEYVKYIDNYYGTLKSEIIYLCSKGKNVILEIERKGAQQIINKFSNVLDIFLVPPSKIELKRRIMNRNTENKKIIKKRIFLDYKEINKNKNKNSYIICNNNLDFVVKKIIELIKKK